MKRLLCVFLFVLLVAVTVAGEPVKVFPGLSEQTIIENEPALNYLVLAVTRVIDGDTFEAWIHIAPRLAYFVDVRVEGADTPELGKRGGKCPIKADRVRVLVADFLAHANEIRVKLTGYSFERWVCVVTVDGVDLATWITENKLTKADLCPEELKSKL